jgi:hypothetical protein
MAWADIFEATNAGLFYNPHWMGWWMPNSNDLVNVTLSGTVELKDGQGNYFKGAPGTAWHRETVNIYPLTSRAFNDPNMINLPPPAPGMAWRASLEAWVVDGSLASIGNDGPANYAGWAIDRFGTIPAAPSDVVDHILLYYDLACRDVDGWIYRLNYYVNFIARLSQYQPHI